MDMIEFIEKLEVFVKKKPEKMSTEELLASLLSIICLVDVQTINCDVTRAGLDRTMSLHRLKDKLRDIKRELFMNHASINKLVMDRVFEAEAGFDSQYDYTEDYIDLVLLETLKREEKEKETEERLRTMDGLNDIIDPLAVLSPTIDFSKYDEAIERIFERQPHYPFEKVKQLDSISDLYDNLVEAVCKMHNATIDFLSEDSPSSLWSALDNDLYFCDIVDVVFTLFSSMLFKPGLTKPQLLLAMNLQGSPLELADDRCKTAASAMISHIVQYYKIDSAFLNEWEMRIPFYFGVSESTYYSHKKDYDEKKAPEKWKNTLSSFHHFLEGLNELKREIEV